MSEPQANFEHGDAYEGEVSDVKNEPRESTALEMLNAKTGELVALPSTLKEIARRDTGGFGRQIQTSIDASTVEGKRMLSKYLDADKPKNHIENDGWFGKVFNMIGYVSKAVLVKKDSNGVVYDVPKPLIRTVVIAEDGDFFISSSSYMFESIEQLIHFNGIPTNKNPIPVKLVKGGMSFKLQYAGK